VHSYNPGVNDRAYDALLLDLDGTLLDNRSRVRPANLDALRRAEAEGVKVIVVTGRSCISAIPVIEELGLAGPTFVFNGAGLWCPRERRLIEERILSNRTVAEGLAYAEREDLMIVAMCAGSKVALEPRNDSERAALAYMHGLTFVSRAELRVEHAIRLTYFSDSRESPEQFAADVEAAISGPIYLTAFPLCLLPNLRESRLWVADVHPPCRGKAEALRYLREEHGIPAERVVAVGDASNDVPMLSGAGLGVAMEASMSEAVEAADRVIGGCDSDAIAGLVEELFLTRSGVVPDCVPGGADEA